MSSRGQQQIPNEAVRHDSVWAPVNSAVRHEAVWGVGIPPPSGRGRVQFPNTAVRHSATGTGGLLDGSSGGGGILATLLARLGYVPASQLQPLTTQAGQLQQKVLVAQNQVASLNSQVVSLTQELETANSAVSSLTTQSGTLSSAISTAQTEFGSLSTQLGSLTTQLQQEIQNVEGLQSQVGSLTSQLGNLATAVTTEVNSVIPGLQTQVGGLQSQLSGLTTQLQALTGSKGVLATLQTQLQGDFSTIQSLAGTLQGLKDQVASYNTVSLPSPPSLTSGPNQTSGDVPGGPDDPGPQSNSTYDPAFQGFVTAGLGNYAASFSVPSPLPLSQGAWTPAQTHAVRMQASSRLLLGFLPVGPRARLASLATSLGYAQSFDASTSQSQASAQVSSLQAALNSLQSQISSLQTAVTSLAGSLSSSSSQQQSLQQNVTAAQGALSNLQSLITSVKTQIGTVTSAIGSAQGQATSLTSQIGLLTSAISSATSGITAVGGPLSSFGTLAGQLNSQVQSLESQIADTETAITAGNNQAQGLTSLHNQNVASISALQNTRIPQWQSYLSSIAAGGLPFSVSWSYGDGSQADATGMHIYQSPGSFQPSVTVNITRPDGVVVSKTFSLPGVLIGQWPRSITVFGGGATTSGTLTFTVFEQASGSGTPVPNVRIFVHSQDLLGAPTGHQVITTDANGHATVGYYGAGSADGRVLRNPTLDVSSSLAQV